MPLALAPDQRAALDRLHRTLGTGQTVLVLTGPAGAGKTTILRVLLDELDGRSVVLCAPTGKAAVRMREVLGQPARTLHSLLYGEPQVDEHGGPIFGEPRPPCQPGDLLVCDEASMVDHYLAEHLLDVLPPGAQVLFVGDSAQLPPVRGYWGAPLEAPTARLDFVHRQGAQSPILALGQHVRRGASLNTLDLPGQLVVSGGVRMCLGSDGSTVAVHQGEVWHAPATWYRERRALGADAVLLAYTNQRRRELLTAVRGTGSMVEGERLVVRSNHHAFGCMNGELYTAQDVEPVPHHPLEVVFGPLIRADLVAEGLGSLGRPKRALIPERLLLPGLGSKIAHDEGGPQTFRQCVFDARDREIPGADRVVHAEYGDVLTVHLSQGSQWQAVGVDISGQAFMRLRQRDPDTAQRLFYTAVTRAQRSLHLWT